MKYFKIILSMLSAISVATSCNNAAEQANKNEDDSSKIIAMSLPSRAAYQQTIDGKNTDLFVLKNHYCPVKICNKIAVSFTG